MRRLDYGDIVDAGIPGARPLVVRNLAFFDPKRPKSAMQPVSVPEIGYYDGLAKKQSDLLEGLSEGITKCDCPASYRLRGVRTTVRY